MCSIKWWGIFHGTERNGNGTQVPEVNVCICILAKLLATHHYKYNSTSTKQEIDQTPGPVLLAMQELTSMSLATPTQKQYSPAHYARIAL